MTDSQPTPPQPEQPPRRLTRSSTDSVIGGVAGGLGRHLNIDPLAIRITFVILSFAGGLGLIAYLVCLAFIPIDDPNAAPMRWGFARTAGVVLITIAALVVVLPHWFWGPAVPLLVVAGVVVYLLLRIVRDDGGTHLSHVAARIAIGIVLLALAVGGFAAAAAGAALGGGIVVAGLVIACGVGLVGGAFRGGVRWLIAPALVLALPLGAVAATDLDLRGTWGDRTFHPVSVADLADGYEMGVGSMKLDLRDVDLPAGSTDLRVEMGMGEIQLLVPDDLCVTTDAEIGVGVVNTGGGDEGGVDVDVEDRQTVGAGVPHLHVIADVGVGAVQVGDRFFHWDGPGDWRGDRFDSLETGTSRAACTEAA